MKLRDALAHGYSNTVEVRKEKSVKRDQLGKKKKKDLKTR